MPSRIVWTPLSPVMPTRDAELLLESLKTFKVTKSHLVACGICNHAGPHAMRVRLLACKCDACALTAPYARCPWRGKTLGCQLLNLMKVEETGSHVTQAPSTTQPRLTEAMKEVAREWAAQGLKPARIRAGFMGRFHLDEASLPPLCEAQRFVHNYAANHLSNNDILSALKTKIREVSFTGEEEESQPFTFSWPNDPQGHPLVGNGSDDKPFVVGVSTKKQLERMDRDPSSFVFHLDTIYKLCQVVYPVLVVGISDKVRTFHVVAIVVMSQQMKDHYATALRAVRMVYLKVMKKPRVVKYVMADADKAQRNAVEEVFEVDCEIVHLMCFFFHLAKKIYEKANGFEADLFAMILRDVHDLHFTSSSNEYDAMLTRVLLSWSAWPELSAFTKYFRKQWLTGMFCRWQMYQTPSAFATTNNPVEQYNAAIKRDVTVHRKLKMGLLLDRLLEWCGLERFRVVLFATVTVANARFERRARELERQGLLSECGVNRLSVAFMLDETPAAPANADVVCVRSVPASRPYNEDQRRRHEDLPASAQLGLNTARMEVKGMPLSGWSVNIREPSCPCRFSQKFSACIHLLFSLNLRGHIDLFGRERLVYRGVAKKRRVSRSSTQGPGRPTSNGHALTIN